MRLVHEFATYLRERIGLEVELDQWADGARQDWSLWALDHLHGSNFVIVVASPEYKRRAEGRAAPDEGRGAQFEASILRDQLTENLRAATKRILPVVLPGGSVRDIPAFLAPYSTTRYEIPAFTESDVAGLISAITGLSQYPRPERAPWRGGAESVARDRKPLPLADKGNWLDHSPGVETGPATIDGICYQDSILVRGIASRPGFVDIDLDRGGHRTLTAVLGVLDDADDQFQVGQFRAHLDGTPRLDHIVARGKPVEVELDLTGIRRLRLEMFRPASGVAPSIPAGGGFSSRAPELAWGDPVVR